MLQMRKSLSLKALGDSRIASLVLFMNPILSGSGPHHGVSPAISPPAEGEHLTEELGCSDDDFSLRSHGEKAGVFVRKPFRLAWQRLHQEGCFLGGSAITIEKVRKLSIMRRGVVIDLAASGPMFTRLGEGMLGDFLSRPLPPTSLLREENAGARSRDKLRRRADDGSGFLNEIIPLLKSISLDMEELLKLLSGELDEEVRLSQAMMHVFGSNERKAVALDLEEDSRDGSHASRHQILEIYDKETKELLETVKLENGRALVDFSKPGSYEIQTVDEETGLKGERRTVIVNPIDPSALEHMNFSTEIIEPQNDELILVSGKAAEVSFAWRIQGQGQIRSQKLRVFDRVGRVVFERSLVGTTAQVELPEGEYAWKLSTEIQDRAGNIREKESGLRRFLIVKNGSEVYKQFLKRRIERFRESGVSKPIKVGP